MAEVDGEAPRARLVPIEGTMAQLNVGRSTVFELIGSGALCSVKIGRRRLIPQSAIDDYVTRLISEATPA